MPNQYNELGQILAQGGEIPIGIAISLGYGRQRIGKLIERKFGAMLESDVAKLYGIAEAGANAGRLITEKGIQTPIDLADIPTNALWGESLHQGNRGIIVAEYSPAEEGSRIQTRFWIPDFNSIEQLFSDLKETLAKWQKQSPGAFGTVLKEYFPDFDISILFAERRF